jgi:hypothetical protein
MPGDILDLIDNALEDWSASDDAMRWRPEAPTTEIAIPGDTYARRSVQWAEGEASGFSPVQFAALWAGSGSGEWTPIGTATELSVQWEPLPDRTSSPYETVLGPQEYTFRLSLPSQIADAFGFWWSEALHYHGAEAPARVTRHCPLCHPRGYVPRLCIDGHAYSRRRAARKKRR